MLFEELQIEITSSSDVGCLNSHRTSTPAWLIRLTAHAGAASLAECRDLCEWFGVERRRATIHHCYQEYAEHHNKEFTVEPDRIAVDKKQIQLENEQKAWLYAAIDVDTKLVLYVQISQHRGCDPAEQFLAELKEKHRVSDAEFLVDGMGYLTALARTDLGGHRNYSERTIVETLFQTFTMRIARFHETWNGSQASAERWLTACTASRNHHHNHQTLDSQPPVGALRQEGSI